MAVIVTCSYWLLFEYDGAITIWLPTFHPAEEVTIIWVSPTKAVLVNFDHDVSGYEPYSSSLPVTANILLPDVLLSITILKSFSSPCNIMFADCKYGISSDPI